MTELVQNYCLCDLKYPELSTIDMETFHQIKWIVLSDDKQDIMFANNLDKVFGYGKNAHGRLGLGHEMPILKQAIIPMLSEKGIKKIVFGMQFAVGLTESMDIYTWGRASSGCLGKVIGHAEHHLHNILGGLAPIAVADAADVPDFCSRPMRLNLRGNYKITDISCGCDHILALTQCGKLLTWGRNREGQLGLGNRTNYAVPKRVQLGDQVLAKSISAGYYHSLVLATDGKIRGFGFNGRQQLGTGNDLSQTSPQMIMEDAKFGEIYATRNTSMALDEKNNVVIWGGLRDDQNQGPITTNVSSFQKAIDLHCKTPSICLPLSPLDAFSKNKGNIVTKTMSKAFDNPAFSDIKFKLKRKNSDEFGYIHCHKWFIAEASEYFGRMLSHEWNGTAENEVTVVTYSYEAYYQYLRCLYADIIDTQDMEVLLELLEIADEYLNDEISAKCVIIIRALVNVENVCSVYCSSLKHRLEDLEEYCYKILEQKIVQIAKTIDFQNADGNYMKFFFKRFYENK